MSPLTTKSDEVPGRSGSSSRRVLAFRPSPEDLEGRRLLSTVHHGAGPRARAAGAADLSPAGGLATAAGVRAIPNLVYTGRGQQPEHLDLYVPTTPAPPGGRPVILALPGGGWRWVRRGDLGQTVSQFAKFGYVVAVADYAYASSQPGSHVWPTNFEDVRQAVRWLKTNSGRFGIDPNKVAVWGESAGAHLASLLGTYPDGPLPTDPITAARAATPAVSARVQAVVDFYGPADLTKLYQEDTKDRAYLNTFLGGTPDQYPQRYQDASPVAHVSAATPPFLVFQGTADTANLLDQSGELVQTLAKAGVPVHAEWLLGLPHGFRLKFASGVDYTPMVLGFLNAALNHPAKP